MNISEINPGTLETSPSMLRLRWPLTLVTAWIIIAFQSRYIFPEGTPFFTRLGWPIKLLSNLMKKKDEGEDLLVHLELEKDSDMYSYHGKETPPSHSSD